MSKNSHNKNIVVASPPSMQIGNVSKGGSCFLAPFLNTADHIKNLESRGLCVFPKDLKSLTRCIESVGYFRFSNYLKHFYQDPKSQKIFKQGVCVDNLIHAHDANNSLRTLLAEALFKIEAHIKALLTEATLNYFQDAYWCYNHEFNSLMEKALPTDPKMKKPPATSLFYHQYPTHTKLPAWVVWQCQDFGSVCWFLNCHVTLSKSKQWGSSNNKQRVKDVLKELSSDKLKIKNLYEVYNGLRHLRNYVAHGEKIVGEIPHICPPVYDNPQEQRTLTNTLKWVAHLMRIIEPNGDFEEKLNQLRNEVCATLPKDLHF